MSRISLSGELGRVRQDYHEGKDIGKPLELCVDLAENLERELDVYRQGAAANEARAVMEEDARQVLEGFDVKSEGTGIHADFGGKGQDHE